MNPARKLKAGKPSVPVKCPLCETEKSKRRLVQRHLIREHEMCFTRGGGDNLTVLAGQELCEARERLHRNQRCGRQRHADNKIENNVRGACNFTSDQMTAP